MKKKGRAISDTAFIDLLWAMSLFFGYFLNFLSSPKCGKSEYVNVLTRTKNREKQVRS